jgi:2'-5' RNA ligase
MRLFVAVPVPEEIRKKAAEAGKEIAMEGVVPVKPENMHVTLKFLGETDERKLAGIEAALRGVAFAPFGCTVKGVGVFPDENYVKVVWAGIESDGKLEALAKEVQEALRGFGDERFSPHLTVARVKRKVGLRQFLQKHASDEFGSFRVSSFALVQSELLPGGPKYSSIAEFAAGEQDG